MLEPGVAVKVNVVADVAFKAIEYRAVPEAGLWASVAGSAGATPPGL